MSLEADTPICNKKDLPCNNIRLKNFLCYYAKDELERVRSIRASERRIWQ